MQNLAQNVANTVCPICGMPVDERVSPVVALVSNDDTGDHIHRLGACCREHAAIVASEPGCFVTAALSNQVVPWTNEDG
jgi:hypothetical protein